MESPPVTTEKIVSQINNTILKKVAILANNNKTKKRTFKDFCQWYAKINGQFAEDLELTRNKF